MSAVALLQMLAGMAVFSVVAFCSATGAAIPQPGLSILFAGAGLIGGLLMANWKYGLAFLVYIPICTLFALACGWSLWGGDARGVFGALYDNTANRFGYQWAILAGGTAAILGIALRHLVNLLRRPRESQPL